MDLYEFLANYGIIGFSVSTALGLAFYEIMKNVSSEIFLPLIGILFNIKNFKDLHLKLLNQNIFVGSLIRSVLAYLAIIVIILTLSHFFFRNLLSKVNQAKTKHQTNLLKEQERTANLLQDIKQQNRLQGMRGFQYI